MTDENVTYTKLADGTLQKTERMPDNITVYSGEQIQGRIDEFDRQISNLDAEKQKWVDLKKKITELTTPETP